MIGWRPALAAAQDPPGLPPFAVEEEAPSRGQLAKEIPLLIGLAILIAFLVKTFVAQAFFIPSGSMIPQLNIGDRVVVSKLAYDLHDPHRGDVVVFDAPPNVGAKPATHDSGLPLPDPMRVSAGFFVTGLSGKTRIQIWPPRLT